MHHFARSLTFALAIALCASAVVAAPAGDLSQPAKWVTRDVSFIYQGLTTQYSCDGLGANARTILRALGARKQEIRLQNLPCVTRGTSEISLSPGVRGTISVLVPATSAEIARGDPAIVPAHWQRVNLMHLRNLDTRHSANCELLEQARRSLLPLFSTRDVDFSATCTPHQTPLVGMTFKVDVLKADAGPERR